jgi:SAM-dependent methyltransferase
MDVLAVASRPFQVARMLGPLNAGAVILDRLARRQTDIAPTVLTMLHGSAGLEIGGPSDTLRVGGPLPLYGVVSSLDNVNFAGETLWESQLHQGGQYTPAGRVLGRQMIMEATSLELEAGSYDFVASSHALEHSANPIAALWEWHRVTRPGGHLVLVVPHVEGTFDHRRPVTPIEHMRADFHAEVREDDPTHFQEFIEGVDLARCPGLTREDLVRRTYDNINNRGVHHHVFDTASVIRLLSETGWAPLAVQARRPWDIFVLARRIDDGLTAASPVIYRSGFRGDRRVQRS